MGLVQLHNLRHSGSTMQSSMGELAVGQVRAQMCFLQLAPAQFSLEKKAFFSSAGESTSNKSQLSPLCVCSPA